jgi:hypothetical protein
VSAEERQLALARQERELAPLATCRDAVDRLTYLTCFVPAPFTQTDVFAVLTQLLVAGHALPQGTANLLQVKKPFTIIIAQGKRRLNR